MAGITTSSSATNSGARSNLRVAIIGGGITGITTAYSLVRRGVDVTLIERQPYPAMETSYANGAQISVCNSEVWNSWASVLKGIRWMFTPGAPLLVSPAPTWQKISWMAQFLRQIPNHDANTIATVKLALEARRELLRILDEEQIAFDLERRGILHIYETAAEYRDAEKIGALLAAGGLERRPVSPAEIRDLEPAVAGTFYGGFYTPSDMTGDIHAFTVGLAEACRKRGVVFQFNREVAALQVTTGGVEISHRSADLEANGGSELERSRFDQVVICAGVGSRRLAGMVGDSVDIYPVKGYSLTVDLTTEDDRRGAPWVSLLDDKAKIVASRLGADRLRIAGTAELSGPNLDIRADRIAPLAAWCRKRFPGVSTRVTKPWAGLRPMMPSMLPRVGPGRMPGIFYNTGHGHLGWTLATATSEQVAILMTGAAERQTRPSTAEPPASTATAA